MAWLASLFGNGNRSTTLSPDATVLDMVTYAAGLASNPADIDPLLDQVRGITARLSADRVLTPIDNSALLGVYLGIEQYLTTKEPLRAFTKEALRARFTPRLREQLTTYETHHTFA